MAPAINTKYPTVNINPTVDDCLKCLRTSDYCQWAGATVASWTYGFVVGRPARFAVAGLMAGIGFTFGSMVVLQNTRGRLLGFRENDREVAKYGAQQVDESHDIRGPMDFQKFK
ncbi:hypothetical protein MPSEU_000144900 [Mayamaea pseudoterrestris]|nr:hypothetical protein MPSEU_000144900 [Mayamaea pseudoterrestris]